MHASTVRWLQPESQPVRDAAAIEFSEAAPVQREIPLLAALAEARFVDDETVSRWSCYREAVVWCWQNQRLYVGMHEQARQTLFANRAGLHAPHASRCLKADSKAPMLLPDHCVNMLEAFTGWRGVRQFQLRTAGLTAMEQVIAQRRSAA
jgi:hypothetical protein